MDPVTAFLLGIALTSGTVFLALLHLRGLRDTLRP